MEIKILAVGDICGEPGLDCLREKLKAFKEENNIGFCVVNGENANVVGITPKQANDIFKSGADVITLGNHTWTRTELRPYLDERSRIIRPANYAPQCPGRGYCTLETDFGSVTVLNLIGRFTLDNNTDNPQRLQSILRALADIARQDNIRIILPLHPRTRKILDNTPEQPLSSCPLITVIPPASFFDITMLEQNAKLIMTDSGGVQKEAFFFEKPCVILRPETEWVEIVNHRAGIIADADYNRIIEAYRQLADHPVQFPHLFGDAHAAEKILQTILDY